jgi:hypothetical protein
MEEYFEVNRYFLGSVKIRFFRLPLRHMHFYLIELETAVDNGITAHVLILGGQMLTPGKWLLRSSTDIKTLTVALQQSLPDRLVIQELAGVREADALRVKWLSVEAVATEPPLEDYSELHPR